MTHKATKNHAGNYTYRGFNIQHSHQEITELYGKSSAWHITSKELSETAETLSEAKQTIDFWIDELGV